MKIALLLLSFAVLSIVSIRPLEAADREGRVRGTVVATDGIAITVDVSGVAMTFVADENTRVEARGAGTAMRRAQSEGRRGVSLADFVAAGQVVDVSYREADGVMRVWLVRRLR